MTVRRHILNGTTCDLTKMASVHELGEDGAFDLDAAPPAPAPAPAPAPRASKDGHAYFRAWDKFDADQAADAVDNDDDASARADASERALHPRITPEGRACSRKRPARTRRRPGFGSPVGRIPLGTRLAGSDCDETAAPPCLPRSRRGRRC